MVTCQFETAAPEESHVYGACAPGWDRTIDGTVDAWITFMQSEGIDRVCCLLSERQIADYTDLLGTYRTAFGADRVAHVPVPDHTLMSPATLADGILPFLESTVAADESVVVHCKAGIGRTGQALAGWLVYAHDYAPADALATVTERHRRPDDAVRAGNATRDDLMRLLAAVS